ncbi:MAG: hypothetical protein PWP24_16 [Clostridiales bacterium]|nr:hypothetical protein [Clostridiales bacterium]
MNLFESTTGSKQIRNLSLILSEYKKILEEYQKKMDSFHVSEEDKMAAVQVALDLTYLKEELDEIKPYQDQFINEIDSLHQLVKEMALTQKRMEEKLAEFDKTILEPVVTNYSSNRIEIIDKFEQVMDFTKKKSKWMVVSFVFSLINLSGIVFVILYLIGIISF